MSHYSVIMQRHTFNHLLKEILILTSIYSVHCCIPGGSIVKYQTIDHSNESIFTWLVTIDNNETNYFALAYGSLIHPKAVLTADIDFTSKPVEEYFVKRDCALEDNPQLDLTNCTKRMVSKIFFHDNQPTSENNWALLILEEPFDITPTIAPINLVNDINAVNTEHCHFIRWTRVLENATNATALMIQPYDTKFVNEEFSPSDLHPEQLRKDRDWLIGDKFNLQVLKKDDDYIVLNFLGSPLSCALKDDDQKFVQVGIATFGFKIPVNPEDSNPITQVGSLIKIIDSYDEIMMKLNENV